MTNKLKHAVATLALLSLPWLTLRLASGYA